LQQNASFVVVVWISAARATSDQLVPDLTIPIMFLVSLHYYSRFRKGKSLLVLLCLTNGFIASHTAAEVGSFYRVDQQSLNITVDGKLDEPEWKLAPSFTDFKVISPDTLAQPKYLTEYKLIYTDKGLYVGVFLQQPKDTQVLWLTSRDGGGGTTNRDAIGLTLDSSGEGRYGYWFNLALGGSLSDGTVLPERQFSRKWDGAWDGASSSTDEGWYAEMFIPWSIISMPKSGSIRKMGISLRRDVAHLSEAWQWPHLARTQSKFMSALPRLELQGVSPRQSFSIVPYASVTADGIDNKIRNKMGAGLFWRPTSNYQVMATITPDFGAVESDDVVVNLSAFETFFPEKRLFFQEGQEIFVTSPRADPSNNRRPFILLHTRRIGGRAKTPENLLDADLADVEKAKPINLLGAVKFNGQFNKFRFGLLAAVEDDIKFGAELNGQDIVLAQSGSDYGVARFLYEDTQGGQFKGIGWMSTLAHHAEGDAVVHSTDLHYLSKTGAWKLDSQMVYSDVDGQQNGAGGFVDIRYQPRQGVNHTLSLDYFDSHLDVNDLGFQVRNDVRGFRYGFGLTKSNLKRVRDYNLFVSLEQKWNHKNQSVDSGLFVHQRFTFRNLANLSLNFGFFPSIYDDRSSDGNGTFKFVDQKFFGLNLNSDGSKPLSVGIDLRRGGEDIGGYNIGGAVAVTWRATNQLTMSAQLDYTKRKNWLLHQDDREFTTFDAKFWRPSFNLDYFFTAKQQFRISLQWVGVTAVENNFFVTPVKAGRLVEVTRAAEAETDSFSISNLNIQVRYRWELAPLSDLFLVYTRTADPDTAPNRGFRGLFSDALSEPIGEQLVLKLRYRLGS